ncbi:unnamed protein product [Kuraishia capsulata CBS 1993]|uniref:6-phosphofructo-2-kinase domain-containing protein n=1 Tax=Kuraishia capsulata CBS 1993 TaxID=1382522 RepID=W6MLT1_9ASCO|nr:uncharacterized protein KUCA_T00003457001 [Kuraishia capsulata CBS 1993]CDK27479.1 unnamed protein product [Kuraishia capsulata CBS 1993]
MTFHRHTLYPSSQDTSPEHSEAPSVAASRSQSTTSINSVFTRNNTSSSLYSLTPEFFPSVINNELDDLNVHFNRFDLSDTVIDETDPCDDTEEDTDALTQNILSDDSSSERETQYAAKHSFTDKHYLNHLKCCASGIFSKKSEELKPDKWCITLVGLPASGKSTMVKHLKEYISVATSNKVRTSIYNAGDVRRDYQYKLSESPLHRADLFDFHNKMGFQLREKFAGIALNQLLDDLESDQTDIGIFDATNSTKERRKFISQQIQLRSPNIRSLILEVKCTNTSMRRYNIERKTLNQDYRHLARDAAVKDFFQRVEKYESNFESITQAELKKYQCAYLCITNVGEQIIYDCGTDHGSGDEPENNLEKRGYFEDGVFRQIASFVANYRENFGVAYLENMEKFYTLGLYKPLSRAT